MRIKNVTQPLYRLGLLAALVASTGCAAISTEKNAMTETAPAVAPVAADSVSEVIDDRGNWWTRLTKAQATHEQSAANGIDTQGDAVPMAHEDLWKRIQNGYAMPELDSPHIARHERWFANNPEYMAKMVNRARLYLYYIVEEVEKRDMPMEIALLPAIESAYQPHAYSRARAVGLWQFIPSTGRLYGLKANWWYDGRRDVIASTQAALDYLEKLHKEFDGDWQLALAAYNCGEGKVGRLMAKNRRMGLPTNYQSLKLPRETVNYVPKLMAMVNIVANPEKYGLQVDSIPNEPYFAQVDIGSQIDLGVIAKLTDMPVTDLTRINPEYVRWITDPNGPHQLLVPADKKDALLAGLNDLPEEDRVQWSHHQVRRGDTIGQVAQKYSVSTEAIKTANRLKGNLLRVGQDLLIPVSGSKLASDNTPIPTAVSSNANVLQDGKVRITHRVRSGDTLWSIAKRYRVYVHQLRQWNLLRANDILRLGQSIQIWTRASPSASLEAPPQG